MADTIFKEWDSEISNLANQNVLNGILNDIRAMKEAIYNLEIDKHARPYGRIIHDDKRIVISAPEIIIGNVNLGGMLNPAGGSTVIIRGNNVAVQGVGDLGEVDVQAPIIQQKAENPGIDGNEHIIGNVSKLVSQACNITIQSDEVAKDGALPPLHEMTTGGILLQADHEVQVKSCLYQDRQDRMKDRKTALENELNDCNDEVNRCKAEYQQAQKEFDELQVAKDALDQDATALRTNYMDRDELNLRMDELSLTLSERVYAYADALSKRGEVARLKKYFEDQEAHAGQFNVDASPSVSISSEVINLKSEDGGGAIQTNPRAGVNVLTNDMVIVGSTDDQGKLLDGNRLAVNMKEVMITTFGTSNQSNDAHGKLENAQYTAEGDVIVRSKNITLESMDYEMTNKMFKEKSLTEDGKIKIRSKNIELSTANSSEVNVDESGTITQAKYKAEGNVTVNSKTFAVTAVDTELNGEGLQEKALTKDSLFSVRTENVGFCSTDTDGKATGFTIINSKNVELRSYDVDPGNYAFKDAAEKGMIRILSETNQSGANKEYYVWAGDYLEANSQNKALFYGRNIAEMKQGKKPNKAVVKLKEGNAKISGKENTVYGETTVNVLSAPEIESKNLHVSKYIKVESLIEGGVEIPCKDKSLESGELDPIDDQAQQSQGEQIIVPYSK